MEFDRKLYFQKIKRIVVKVGSNVLTQNQGLNIGAITSISHQISQLMDQKIQVILVSSGAMASGAKRIGLGQRPKEIPKRQAIAAIGQAGLINEYDKVFTAHDKHVAQILLTRNDLCDRKRYLNTRNTIHTLLDWSVLPIINENDTVAVEEIKFGDNDNLSAMIAVLLDADVLINLTDIDGLYDKNPHEFGDAKLIPLVIRIDDAIRKIASDIPGALGTGGMLTKIEAAEKVCATGIPMIIAKGKTPDILIDLFAGKMTGTFFLPSEKRLSQRKSWLAFTVKPAGRITIDDGAVNAILTRGKSLLASGITEVEGKFDTGEPIAFVDCKGNMIGIGLVNYDASDIQKIKGLKSDQIEKHLGYKSYDEVIHRDNLAVTNGYIQKK